MFVMQIQHRSACRFHYLMIFWRLLVIKYFFPSFWSQVRAWFCAIYHCDSIIILKPSAYSSERLYWNLAKFYSINNYNSKDFSERWIYFLITKRALKYNSKYFFIDQRPEICSYYTQTQNFKKNFKIDLDFNQEPIKYGIAYGKICFKLLICINAKKLWN